MEHPDPKKHQLISFVKSGIRIIGGLAAVVLSSMGPLAIATLGMSFVIAEIIGIYEELV